MKYLCRTVVLGSLLAGLLGSTAVAQTRIATVDLNKVVNSYWKKDQAYSTLKETSAGLEKELKEMDEDVKKAYQAWQKQLEDASDPAISADEREKRRKQADDKKQDYLKKGEDFSSADKRARLDLNERKTSVDNKLLAEIRNVIAARAKTGGFTLVLNAGIEAAVMYASPEGDITDQVVLDLNATNPSRSTSADSSSDDKKKKK